MDRFRFRAWDDEAGEFTYSFVEDDNYVWGFEDGKLKAWAIRLNPGTIDEPPYPESVELGPPEQSTDLPDKTGKYQFKNDIVDHPSAGTAVVVWHQSSCSYQARSLVSGLYYNMSKDAEIIGNAMENPELLEAANEDNP